MTELDNVLVNAITKMGEGIEKGVDFAVDQAPEVIRQALVWHMTLSIIMMVGFFFVALFAIWINLKQVSLWRSLDDWEEYAPLAMLNIMQLIWLIPLGHLWSLDFLMIWIAPKLWLIEYAAGLTK